MMSRTMARTSGSIALAVLAVKYFLPGLGLRAAMSLPSSAADSLRRRGRRLGRRGGVRLLLPDGLGDQLRRRDRRRVERGLTPGHLDRQFREVHDAAVAAVATNIVVGAHEDAVD